MTRMFPQINFPPSTLREQLSIFSRTLSQLVRLSLLFSPFFLLFTDLLARGRAFYAHLRRAFCPRFLDCIDRLGSAQRPKMNINEFKDGDCKEELKETEASSTEDISGRIVLISGISNPEKWKSPRATLRIIVRFANIKPITTFIGLNRQKASFNKL